MGPRPCKSSGEYFGLNIFGDSVVHARLTEALESVRSGSEMGA